MYRRGDLSTTHGPELQGPRDEPQFEGVVFSDGTCAIRWRTAIPSTSIWRSFADAMVVHGHPEARYGSELVWLDG